MTEEARERRRDLRAGANVTAQDDSGETPLHLAASRGKWRVAALLVSNGVDLFAQAHNGATPCSLVASQNGFFLFPDSYNVFSRHCSPRDVLKAFFSHPVYLPVFIIERNF